MTRHRAGFTMIELVVVIAILGTLIALLLPAVQSAREAARRLQCANNLLQLGIAIENYESTYLVYPPGSIDRSGPVIESPTAYQFGWIARILPYLEQKNVYNRLDFRAGVYEAANWTARGVSLSALLCPSDGRRPIYLPGSPFGIGGPGSSTVVPPEPRTTSYAACHNDVESPIDSTNSGVFPLNRPIRIEDVEDGFAHTIFLGEKLFPGDEQGWASGTRATLRNTGTPINKTNLNPTDLAGFTYQLHLQRPNDPAATVGGTAVPPTQATILVAPIRVGGFSSFHPNGANFLFGDGSARFLRSTIHSDVYRRLGSRADGEPIGDDAF